MKHTKLMALDSALQDLSKHNAECRLCPRQCSINRSQSVGYCQSGSSARVSSALLHYGEEPVLSGVYRLGRPSKDLYIKQKGSGTVFFSDCNLRCLFCQNHQISWQGQGELQNDEDLADMMLGLQDRGAANINLVSPSHVLLPILRALRIALLRGLSLPIVYNSNGYESSSVLRCLEGIVDIYLPDFKYSDAELAQILSQAPDYYQAACAAILEMYCQQPVLELTDDGYARRGVIVRHLVLPGKVQNTRQILRWISENISTTIGLSLMSQYTPCFNTPPEFQKNLTIQDYKDVCQYAEDLGFENVFLQPEPFERDENLTPDFKKKNPFSWGGKK